MKKPTVWAGKSAQAVFVSLRCLLNGIAGTGARRFPFISKMEGFFDEKKSLAHCSGGRGDPHVYRKCVCMERPYAPCDGDDGALAFRDHLGLLDRDPVSGAFGRLLRPSGRAAGTVSERDGLCRLFSTGLLGTAAAVHCQSAFLLYLFYGAIGGIGLGTGYITPVSTLVKWFPRHRGFATGLAIMGFGFAALIAGPAMRYLVDRFGLTENFLILAAAYALVMILSASYIRPPRKGEIPMLLEEVLEEEIRKDGEKTAQAKGLTRKEAMHTWKWYVLWWIFFTNITCGIGLLAVASPMAQEIIGMSAAEAASLVGIIGIVNGAGRILWASVSDWIGRGVTYMIFFAFEVFAFYALAHVSDALLFEILVLAVISCYGGGFSCMPAFLSDLFGVKQLASIHGSILTAWGMAGVAGPLLLSFMKETTGGYAATLHLFSAMLAVAFALSWVLAWKGRK